MILAAIAIVSPDGEEKMADENSAFPVQIPQKTMEKELHCSTEENNCMAAALKI